jgi:hypothetical protein
MKIELVFLELLHERLDTGEDVYDSILHACLLGSTVGSSDLTLAGMLLKHARQHGLAKGESMDIVIRNLKLQRLKQLFIQLKTHEQSGTACKESIEQLIESKIRGLYLLYEEELERLPYKLMGVSFVFLFPSVVCFLLAAMAVVMEVP